MALPRDAVDEGRPKVHAVEHEPREFGLRGRPRPGPAVPVHHGEPIPEDMDPRQKTAIEDRRALRTGDEVEPQQHDHARAQVQRVSDELIGDFVGGDW